MKKFLILWAFVAIIAASGCCGANDNDVDSYSSSEITWSGYTNWWNSDYSQQVRCGNLSKIRVPDAAKILEQRRIDMATALGIPFLQLQEGFLLGLLTEQGDGKGRSYAILDNPSEKDLNAALGKNKAVLVFAPRESELGGTLDAKAPEYEYKVPAYQIHGGVKDPLKAFILKKGSKHIYAAVGKPEDLAILKEVLAEAQDLTDKYDMKRGWFGMHTDVRTVSCSAMTPIETMALGMNEGNSWFVFSGEYERFIKPELERWISESASGVEAAVGTHSLYDCRDWEGFQEQLLKDNQFEYAKERDARGGYLFRPIQDWGDYAGTGMEIYDGYFASAGNAEIVDTCAVPFVINNGNVINGATNPMVLFVPKGEQFSRQAMWAAIMDRREVAIESAVEEFTVMGDTRFRRPIQLMLAERAFIENYFGDQVGITARVEELTLKVKLENFGSKAVKGAFDITLPPTVSLAGSIPGRLNIPAHGVKSLSVDLKPTSDAMGRRSAITIGYDWGASAKKVMAEMDMPLAVATHKLLYGTTSGCKFPVSVYNFTNNKKVDVKVSVTSGSEVAFEAERSLTLAKAASDTLAFDLKLPVGSYTVTTESMGATATTQLGIGEEDGDAVKLWKEDVNGDGIDEIYMENSRVKVMLLAIGARIMEYTDKESGDNVLFKNWPNEPYDPERPYRKRNFWPFGGFEDFLGQASVETHEVYDCEVLKDGGEYAEVRMVADYYGNKIEKIFTLYGDTPLLGIRFALDMVNEEFNMLGPQPILEVGQAHDPQDRIIVPEKEGLSDYRVDMADYWGKFLFPVEGWNVDYDTVEDIYFAGAFPVDAPYTLHMWHNHPRNRDTRFYYCELQPWTELLRGNTTYFSYYMWNGSGSWETGIEELRGRNLITAKQ